VCLFPFPSSVYYLPRLSLSLQHCFLSHHRLKYLNPFPHKTLLFSNTHMFTSISIPPSLPMPPPPSIPATRTLAEPCSITTITRCSTNSNHFLTLKPLNSAAVIFDSDPTLSSWSNQNCCSSLSCSLHRWSFLPFSLNHCYSHLSAVSPLHPHRKPLWELWVESEHIQKRISHQIQITKSIAHQNHFSRYSIYLT